MSESPVTVRPSPPTSPGRGRVARLARAAGSLLAYVVVAVVLTVASDPLLQAVAYPTGVASARGHALAFALIGAIALWAAPSVLPRRAR